MTNPKVEYLTVQQAADLVGFHERTVRRAITDGRLPAFRAGVNGHRLRIRRADAIAWIERDPVTIRPGPLSRRQAARGRPEPGSYADLMEIFRGVRSERGSSRALVEIERNVLGDQAERDAKGS